MPVELVALEIGGEVRDEPGKLIGPVAIGTMMASRFKYRGSAVPELFAVVCLSWVAASRYPPPARKLAIRLRGEDGLRPSGNRRRPG